MSFAWPASGKHRLWLPVSSEAWVPVLAVFSPQPGPLLLISAGFRGDESLGIRAAYETFEEIEPDAIRGRILSIPVMNPPAHRAGTRLGPVDGRDLAMAFPGRPEGSVTEQIAFAFGNELLVRADFYLELRSTGQQDSMPFSVGYDGADSGGRAAAAIFGSPV